MRYPFGSAKSRELNKQIFETLYYGALEASCELAEKYGTYSSYYGSPISQGVCILKQKYIYLYTYLIIIWILDFSI